MEHDGWKLRWPACYRDVQLFFISMISGKGDTSMGHLRATCHPLSGCLAYLHPVKVWKLFLSLWPHSNEGFSKRLCIDKACSERKSSIHCIMSFIRVQRRQKVPEELQHRLHVVRRAHSGSSCYESNWSHNEWHEEQRASRVLNCPFLGTGCVKGTSVFLASEAIPNTFWFFGHNNSKFLKLWFKLGLIW